MNNRRGRTSLKQLQDTMSEADRLSYFIVEEWTFHTSMKGLH